MATVRSRTEEDVEACVLALRVLYETENYPQGANRDLKYFLTNEKNQRAWVAEHKGKIIGHVSTSTIAADAAIDLWKTLHLGDNAIALLSRLFVSPEHRNAGVAAKLVNEAVRSSHEQGNRLLLSVTFESKAAIRLYERLGWIKFGETMIPLGDSTRAAAICFASPLST